jgi:radical SAM superfamily enzyme YgiQ (UPF0313 family)
MAKVALVNPSMDFQRAFGGLAPFMEPAPCIGLARIGSLMKELGLQVRGVDAYSLRLSALQASEIIADYDPHIVGVSCLTPSAPWVKELIRKLRKRAGRPKIILGNVHASLFAEEFILCEGVDAVVHGEGEDTLRELVPLMLSDKALEAVRGISFLKNGTVVKNEPRPLISDLDRLPLPRWDIFDYRNYGALPFVTIKKPSLTIEGSRGCPYSCSFCCLGHMGKRYRLRSISAIVDEFAHTVFRYGARQIDFADAVFPLTERQGLEFCNEVIRRGLEKECIWVSETRTDVITPALAKAMRQAGCRRILFGIESGSQAVLDKIEKKLALRKHFEAIEICRQVGIQTCGFFILGLPGEDRASSKETIRLALSLALDFAKFNILIPYPGSPIYQEALKKGELLHRNWEDYSCYVPTPQQLPWVAQGREPAELISLQKCAIRRFYLRPNIVLRHLFIIRSIELRFLIRGGYLLIMEAIKSLFEIFLHKIRKRD